MTDCIARSEDFAGLFRKEPRAAALFLMLLPHADCFGILPGNLKVLKGLACPLLGLSDARFSELLGALDKQLLRYADAAGQPLIWVRKYHLHQSVNWERVTRPDNELPPEWSIPDGLIAAANKPKLGVKRGTSERLREWFMAFCKERGMPETTTVNDSQRLSPLEVDVDTDVEQTQNCSTATAGEDCASAEGCSASSSTATDKDGHDQAVTDLCLALGVETLPEAWDYLCTDWVGRFDNKAEGRSFLYGLIRVEADRIRADGKRKGSPKLSEYLSRAVNNRVAEKKRYYD